MISAGSLIQTKGVGWLVPAFDVRPICLTSALDGVEGAAAHRLAGQMLNHASTMLSHDAPVGVK